MLNRRKRTFVKIIPLMFLAVFGAEAIQALSVSVFFNTLVSLNYAQQALNITVDMTRATQELSGWTLFTAFWLVVVHIAVLWYIGEKLEKFSSKRWPDEPGLKLRQTKKGAYKGRST